MREFDPERDIKGSDLIVKRSGSWPSFHDARIYRVEFWRGEMKFDCNNWIGPTIEVSIEVKRVEYPYIVTVKFDDCDKIMMGDFDYENMIFDLQCSFEYREPASDNSAPLLPYICVNFVPNVGISLNFRCFNIEILRVEAIR